MGKRNAKVCEVEKTLSKYIFKKTLVALQRIIDQF